MFTVLPYTDRDLESLATLLARYVRHLPCAKVMPAEFYTYHPALAAGRNTVAVVDDGGALAGFAPLFVAPVDATAGPETPHTIWSVMLVDPTQPDPTAVREGLFAALVTRAHELAATLPPRRVRLAADLTACQQDEIADLRRRGFMPFARVMVMARTLDGDVPVHDMPSGVRLVPDRLATADTQARYVAAYNVCFPHAPKTTDDLRFLLAAPGWAQGGAMIAWADGELVGSVVAYETETPGVFAVDDVFVLPAWRGQGVARGLLAAALQQARTHGATRARLEVDAASTPAVALYRGSGFEVADEETLLALDLTPPDTAVPSPTFEASLLEEVVP